MSASIFMTVTRSDLQPLGVRTVALLLAWHVNEKTGVAWPSNGSLAQECGLTRDRVRHCLKDLREQGVIEVASLGTGGNQFSTTRYRFVDTWLARFPAPSDRGSTRPGSDKTTEGGSYEPEPGSARTPKKDERKAKPSLSSKSRRSAAAGPGRAAAGSSLAAARTGFTDPSYYDQEVTP